MVGIQQGITLLSDMERNQQIYIVIKDNPINHVRGKEETFVDCLPFVRIYE